MTAISGTNVSAPITPFDSNDQFPTHIDNYGKGGYRSVNTYSELSNISSDRKAIGMKVLVLDTKNEYYLDSDLTTWIKFNPNIISNNINVTINSDNIDLELPYANTTQFGIVKLYDNIDSNSNSLVATANSVNFTYNLANSKSKNYYQNTLPNLNLNDIWVDSNTGIQYIYANSNNSNILFELGNNGKTIDTGGTGNVNSIGISNVYNIPVAYDISGNNINYSNVSINSNNAIYGYLTKNIFVDSNIDLYGFESGKSYISNNTSNITFTLHNSIPEGWCISVTQYSNKYTIFSTINGTLHNFYNHNATGGLYAEVGLKCIENTTGNNPIINLFGITSQV